MTIDVLPALIAATHREQALALGAAYTGAMGGPPDKLAALHDACAAFRELSIRYALIGGVAVGLRSGVPRATLDVDFAVHTSVDRALLTVTLEARGFAHLGSYEHSVNFRHVGGEPVQLAFDAGFDSMIDRAEVVEAAGLSLHVVRTADLITMKRRAAADPARRRSKALRDLADIALLEDEIPDPHEGW